MSYCWEPRYMRPFELPVGSMVEVRTHRYRDGAASVAWLGGVVTYADQTGFDVRIGCEPETTRLARWGEGDTWRRVGEVFA